MERRGIAPALAETDDLHISPFREDGKTYGTPTWIWSVVVDDSLCVRAYNGRNSGWYQAAMRQRAGRIAAAGMIKEVTFRYIGKGLPIVDLAPITTGKAIFGMDVRRPGMSQLLQSAAEEWRAFDCRIHPSQNNFAEDR